MPKFKSNNPIPSKTRDDVIKILHKRLADAIDLQTQIKIAHWNVKGPRFIGLHELFDEVYEKVVEMVDDIAERLVALGGSTQENVQNVVKNTCLTPYPVEITGGIAHVKAVAKVLGEFSGKLYESLEKCAELGDPGTEDILTGMTTVVDQYIWFVEAHLQDDK